MTKKKVFRIFLENWSTPTIYDKSTPLKGRMEGKEEGEDQGKNYWTGWWARNTANLKKKLNIEKHVMIGGLNLPEGRELKEEVIENSQK